MVRNFTESEDGIATVFKEVGKEMLSCQRSVELCYGWVKFWERRRCSSGIFTFSFYDFLKERYLLTPYNRSPRQPVLASMSNGTSEQRDLILSYANLLSFPLSKFVFRKPKQKFEALQDLASLN